MVGSTRSNYYSRKLLICLLALMLTLALPAVALAQGTSPGDPPTNPDANPDPPQGPPQGPPNGGTGGGNGGNGGNGMGPGDGNGMGPPVEPPGPDGPGPGGPPNGGMNGGMDDDKMMMMGPSAAELANRVVKHVATPVQLVIAGDGFHFFFIGADGSTVSGPVLPGFAELAEMHPSGGWVSLLDAANPLTGKQVYVDYIPKDMTIRVFTYYPDKGMDVDKQYIFNFGADLDVNVEAW